MLKTFLSAARALEQINNQIAQIQNQAQMLMNDALNLANLPHSSLAQLQDAIGETQRLLADAQSLAFDVATIEQAFAQDYGTAAAQGDFDAMIGRRARSVGDLPSRASRTRCACRPGSWAISTARELRWTRSFAESQGAVGALQVAQAGNQLLALQSTQIADLTAAIAAQNRAEALEAARIASAEAQGRENLARFLDYGRRLLPRHSTAVRGVSAWPSTPRELCDLSPSVWAVSPPSAAVVELTRTVLPTDTGHVVRDDALRGTLARLP